MELFIKAEEGTRLYGKVFEAIRGFEGVTVIRSTEKIQRDSQNNKLMNLSVRFYVNPAYAIPYIEKLKNAIRNLKDAEGDRILSVEIRKMPEKVDKIYT
jgi:CTP:molybdopterin cytidylyltransferase MocA